MYKVFIFYCIYLFVTQVLQATTTINKDGSPIRFIEVCMDNFNFPISDQLIVNKILSTKQTNPKIPFDCTKQWQQIKNVKQLDLSDLNITELTVLRDFKNLRYLNISNNYISNVEDLQKLPKLININLSNNCIENITYKLYNKLKYIDLKNNILSENLKEFIKFEKNISHKNTDDFQLKEKMFLCKNIKKDMVNSLLHKIKEHGLILKDVINLEDINIYDDLSTALNEIGLVNISIQDVIKYLDKIHSLLDHLYYHSNNNNPIAPYIEYNEHQHSSSIIKDYLINYAKLNEKVELENFYNKFLELKKSIEYREDFHLDFYYKLTESHDLLAAASSQINNPSIDNKKSQIILFLAAIKGYQNGTPYKRMLSDTVYSLLKEKYSTRGQSLSWFSEMNYKLYALYKVYDQLPNYKKNLLITYFLHGSMNCSDAKWHAINGAYAALISDQILFEKKEYHSPFHELSEKVKFKAYKLKSDSLTSYIEAYISANPKYQSEYCTYFNTTWDRLAQNLSLAPVGSIYSKHVIEPAVNNFNKRYYELVNSPALLKVTKDDILSILKKEYFGPLENFISNQDFLAIGILRYFNYLKLSTR